MGFDGTDITAITAVIITTIIFSYDSTVWKLFDLQTEFIETTLVQVISSYGSCCP